MYVLIPGTFRNDVFNARRAMDNLKWLFTTRRLKRRTFWTRRQCCYFERKSTDLFSDSGGLWEFNFLNIQLVAFWCYHNFTKLLPKLYQNFTRKLLKSYQNDSKKLSEIPRPNNCSMRSNIWICSLHFFFSRNVLFQQKTKQQAIVYSEQRS